MKSRCTIMIKSFVPIAVSTGSFYPAPTLASISQLRMLGIQNVELTLQSHEFFLALERKLSMPIYPDLLEQVQSGQLRIGSIHAPMMGAHHGYNMRARLEYLIHTIETCRSLGGNLVVIHPFHLLRTHEDALNYLAGDIALEASLLPGISDVLEQAQAANITLALENIQDWLDEVFFQQSEQCFAFPQ